MDGKWKESKNHSNTHKIVACVGLDDFRCHVFYSAAEGVCSLVLKNKPSLLASSTNTLFVACQSIMHVQS
jgi:hypothetical protein